MRLTHSSDSTVSDGCAAGGGEDAARASAIERFGGDRLFYCASLAHFQALLPDIVVHLRRQLLGHDPSLAAGSALTLKETAAALGLTRLAEVAADIEDAVGGPSVSDRVLDLVERIEEAVALTFAVVGGWTPGGTGSLPCGGVAAPRFA